MTLSTIVYLEAYGSFGIKDFLWVGQVTTPWVLTLDADYFVPEGFVKEMAALEPPPDVAGYEARFLYAIDGRPLRSALYPPRVVLLRRVERMRTPLIHDDRKDLRRFIERQRNYMRQEATKLRATRWAKLPVSGRIRKLRVVAPFATLFYTLFAKRAILDGRPGWRYAAERFLAETLLSVELLRRHR